jgi:hypothetical protein
MKIKIYEETMNKLIEENKWLKKEISEMKVNLDEQEKGFVKAFKESRQIYDSPISSAYVRKDN